MNQPSKPPRWRVVSLRPRGRLSRMLVSLAFLCAVMVLGTLCIQTMVVVSEGVAALSHEIVRMVQGPSTPPYALQTAPPYIVALDPGHGGGDTGANALVKEVGVCEATVDELYRLLDVDPNYTPVRTRPNGKDLSTADRAKAATDARASAFISVHANMDHTTGQSHGFECFPTPPGRLYSEQSMQLALCIAEKMGAAGHRLRGENGIRFAYYNGRSKQIVDGSDTRVRSQKSFGVVEKPYCPAVLVEQCFLTNYQDTETWASEEGCKKAAHIYYEGLCAYFGTQPRV